MKPLPLDQWQAYLVAQARSPLGETPIAAPCAVTISRETGAGASVVAQKVIEILESQHVGNVLYPWAAFDRELVTKALTDHSLPATLAHYMPEDAQSQIIDLVEELLGAHPPSWTLLQQTNETIKRLANRGNVILIGRGSHLVTTHLPHVFHVRLVAPVTSRVSHVMQREHLPALAAAEYVQKGDKAKARYIRRNFGSRVQDPLQFHLTINTGLVGFQKAAEIIARAVSLVSG